MQLPNLVG